VKGEVQGLERKEGRGGNREGKRELEEVGMGGTDKGRKTRRERKRLYKQQPATLKTLASPLFAIFSSRLFCSSECGFISLCAVTFIFSRLSIVSIYVLPSDPLRIRPRVAYCNVGRFL
jgi:hypothetical protein